MARKLLLAFAVVSLLVYALLGWGAWESRKWVRLALAEIEAEGQPWQEISRETKTFSVPAGRRLVIENERGDVKVIAGGREVVAEAVYSARGEAAAAARRKAGSFALTGGPEGRDAFRIACTAKDSRHSRWDLTLHAPVDLAIEIENFAGDLEVSGRQAAVSLTDQAGNVRVSQCRGPVTVRNGAGDIEVSSVPGEVAVSASAGEIMLKDLRGRVRADNSAGNITVRDAKSDDLRLTNSAGNIEVGLAGPFTGRLFAHSGAGNVTVSVPRGARCRVKAHAGLGQVTNSLPSGITAGNPPGLLEASTSMGNVEITAAE